MPINKFVKPIRKPLRAPSKKLSIEYHKDYYIFILEGRRLKVTKYNAIRLAQWIIENG